MGGGTEIHVGPDAPSGTPTTNDIWLDTDESGGSGGGGLAWPDSPPSSPSDYDDEFTTATLDAKWTVYEPDSADAQRTVTYDSEGTYLKVVRSPTATHTRHGQRLVIDGSHGNSGVLLTFYTQIYLTSIANSGSPLTQFEFGDSSTFGAGNRIEFRLNRVWGNTYNIRSTVDGAGFVDVALDLFGGVLCFAFARTAGNVCHLFIGKDPRSLLQIRTFSKTFNITNFHLACGLGANIASIHLTDYVRFNDSRLLLPI